MRRIWRSLWGKKTREKDAQNGSVLNPPSSKHSFSLAPLYA
jgi:hypothetical protein